MTEDDNYKIVTEFDTNTIIHRYGEYELKKLKQVILKDLECDDEKDVYAQLTYAKVKKILDKRFGFDD